MENQLQYRMYGLVPYNISPIQQGIQFGHAVVEYANQYFDTPIYQKWATKDKTFIILNGGTTNTSYYNPGTINKHIETLILNGIKFATFSEPDLGDQITAVVFLVDERVWDKITYPDYLDDIDVDNSDIDWFHKIPENEIDTVMFLRDFLSQFKKA